MTVDVLHAAKAAILCEHFQHNGSLNLAETQKRGAGRSVNHTNS